MDSSRLAIMAETETKHHPEHHDDDVHDANYQAPPEKTIEEIMAADQEDESLRRYKEALLGAAQTEKIIVGKGRLTWPLKVEGAEYTKAITFLPRTQ